MIRQEIGPTLSIVGLWTVLLHLRCGQQPHPPQCCGAGGQGPKGVWSIYHQPVGNALRVQPLHSQESRQGYDGSLQENIIA